jgi:hypothetical protein
LAALSGCCGTPFTQRFSVQSSPSSGRSLSSAASVDVPDPLQTNALQSPTTEPATGVPAGTKLTWQEPLGEQL